MYAHMHHAMIHALEAERRAAAERSAGQRPARAAPVPDGLRRMVGRALVRAGTRLAPETAPATTRAACSHC